MPQDKLNQALDTIINSGQGAGRTRGSRRGRGGRANATRAPVGGVQKATKQAKQTTAAAAPAKGPVGDAKLMVSNLPLDVEENQLKDYFAQLPSVGRPKRVIMQYGPQGRSLGSATVIFFKHDQTVKAAKELDKIKIDNRPIRVELLMSAANVPAAAAQPNLNERITQSKKDKPKPATAVKAAPAGGRGRGQGQGRGRGRGRGGRQVRKKTAEELDQDMADYFPDKNAGTDNMATNGSDAVQAGAEDINMDEML